MEHSKSECGLGSSSIDFAARDWICSDPFLPDITPQADLSEVGFRPRKLLVDAYKD